MVQPTEPAQNFEAKFWHIPLSRDQITLREALDEMHRSGDRQKDIPLLVQLVENPKYQLPEGFKIFHGRVDLFTHDCLHILLGRGMLPAQSRTNGVGRGVAAGWSGQVMQ